MKKLLRQFKEIYDRVFPITLSWWEPIGILFAGFVIIFGILYRTGCLSTGYHFLDDHEIIRYVEMLRTDSSSVLSLIHNIIVGDMGWRFRPFYWVERIFVTYSFGTEFTYWNYYIAIKGVLTFYLLYFFARYLDYPHIVSFFFPCVVMLGTQFTPWYRNGNQESLGLLLCAFTFYLIAKQSHHKKYRSIVYNVLIAVGAVLCGLTKESFTLIMPVFAALKFWLEYCEKYERIKWKDMWNCFRENFVVYLLIIISMSINIYIIVFHVGVDNVSYAGFHEGASLEYYLQRTSYNLTVNLRVYTYMGLCALFAAVMCYQNFKNVRSKKYFGFVMIGIYIMSVQLAAHATSLMWERYIIPWILGYALVFVLLTYQYFRKDIIQRLFYIAFLSILIALELPKAYSQAASYYWDGKLIQIYFQTILDHTDEQSHIISAYSDEELNLATECWLEVHDRTQVYTYFFSNETLRNLTQIHGENVTDMSWNNAVAATCYASQVEQVAALMGFTDAEEYVVMQSGNYCVIYRDND